MENKKIITKMIVLDEWIDSYPDYAVIEVTEDLVQSVRKYAEVCAELGCDRISRFDWTPRYMIEKDSSGKDESQIEVDDLEEWDGASDCDMIDVSKTHFRWSSYIKHTNVKILTADIPLSEIGIGPVESQPAQGCPGALNRDDNSDSDYTLVPEQSSVWVTVDNISVYISRNDEGVVVDLFAKGGEDRPPMGSTWATFAEADPADDEFRCAGCGKIEEIDDSMKVGGKHGELCCLACAEDRGAEGDTACRPECQDMNDINPAAEVEIEKPYFNHMCDICFTVISHDPTGENLTADELLVGLKRRLADLELRPNEIIEAVGMPVDTYEEDPNNPSVFLAEFVSDRLTK